MPFNEQHSHDVTSEITTQFSRLAPSQEDPFGVTSTCSSRSEPYDATTSVELANDSSDESKSLDASLFSKWENELLSNPKNQLALGALTGSNILRIIQRREAVVHGTAPVYSHRVDVEGPVTNQKNSRRCWIFAATNIM